MPNAIDIGIGIGIGIAMWTYCSSVQPSGVSRPGDEIGNPFTPCRDRQHNLFVFQPVVESSPQTIQYNTIQYNARQDKTDYNIAFHCIAASMDLEEITIDIGWYRYGATKVRN